MDLVACAIGQRGQQQSRFDGGIQAGRAPQGDGVDLRVRGGSQQRGGGSPAVHDDDDMAVAFGPPLAHHQFGGARGGAPVDVARVVSFYVGAQGVELGSGPAQSRGCRAFQLVQARQARGQQDACLELGEDGQRQGCLETGLAGPQVQRSPGSDGDDVGVAGAPARGSQRRDNFRRRSRVDAHAPARRSGVQGRRPRVAHVQGHASLRRVDQAQRGLGRLVGPDRPGDRARQAQGTRRGSSERVDDAYGDDQTKPHPREGSRRGEDEGDEPDEDEKRAARRDSHGTP